MFFLKKGVVDCKIVISENAHIVEKTAAEELQNYIEKALSVSLPVVSEKEAAGRCMFVGHTEYAKDNNILGNSKENWIIKENEGKLILTGGAKRGDRGIIYSVYHFLEDVLGVRWWNPYEEDVPALDSLSLDDNFHIEGTPCFPYRKPILNRPLGDDGIKAYPHIIRTRTNVISEYDDAIPGGAHNPEIRKFGDMIHMGRPHHCHVMGKRFPADEYFDEHPDWWAWNDAFGKRIKEGHRCLTNESFIAALTEKLLETIEEDVRLREETGVEFPHYYSVSPDDLPGFDSYCQCPECKKVISEAGYGGYVLRFVNEIARRVREVYPFARIEHLAYFTFIEPPKDDTVPEKNVVVRLANIYVDILRDIHSPSNKRYLRLLKEWSALCGKTGCELQIWDYMFLMRLNYPLPVFYRLSDTIKTMAEYGVSGFCVEIEEHYSDMWELNKYMLTHLIENPYADEDALLRDFTDRYYGAAGGYVREYCELLHRASEMNEAYVYCCLEDSPFNYVDYKTAKVASEILEKAQGAVKGKEPYCERINWLSKALYVAILSKYHDLKASAERAGDNFEFDCEKLRKFVCDALSEYSKKPINKLWKSHIEMECAHYMSLPKEKPEFDIPDELSGVKNEDIYQFPLNNLYGFATVSDETAATKKPIKLATSVGMLYGWGYEMLPTSKDAEHKKSVKFSIYQDDKDVSILELYKEDFSYDKFTLYKVGSVDNLMATTDTALIMYVLGAVSLNLRALAVTFPMDKCDVYLEIKASGKAYGGNAADEDALCFDRLIVVRR